MTNYLIIILALFALWYHVRNVYQTLKLRGHTTITVTDSMFFEEGDTIHVDGDLVKIIKIEGNTLTVDKP
jgi:membrane protein implicated in regulation of membrane protease activity